MLSFRILSNSIRSVAALPSNQCGSSLGAQSNLTSNATNNQPQCAPKSLNRSVSTSNVHYQKPGTPRLCKVSNTMIDVEPKPKKPPTPWVLFIRDRKEEILRQYGKLTSAQLTSILAKEWPQVDKTKYEQEYKRMHDEYLSRVKDYDDSLTDDQRDLIDQQKKAKQEAKAIRLLRRTNPPVMPRNPANLYVQERYQQDDVKRLMKTHKLSEVASEIFKEYRSLSEEEKQKYLNMQMEDKVRFQHEFLIWYEDVQSNESLTKASRDHADVMLNRLRALKYI